MNKITTKLSAIVLVIIVAFSVLSVTASAGSDSVSGSEIASYARSLAGRSYARGGKGPNSFDCSGVIFELNQPVCNILFWPKNSFRNNLSMWKS